MRVVVCAGGAGARLAAPAERSSSVVYRDGQASLEVGQAVWARIITPSHLASESQRDPLFRQDPSCPRYIPCCRCLRAAAFSTGPREVPQGRQMLAVTR